MDKKSTPEKPLLDTLSDYEKKGLFPKRYTEIIKDFICSYREAVEQGGVSFAKLLPQFSLFLKLVEKQLKHPFAFEPYHQKIRSPIDYYQFSLDFISPLIDFSASRLLGKEHLMQATKQLERGENVIFLANHQTEPDPQAIALLLRESFSRIAETTIYVAGERVVTDPLAIPFSMGTNLLCIYSKRYIDHPPELKAEKLLHNKQTMDKMSRLLQEGGKAIYVAPSGGRDRPDETGKVEPAPFNPESVELIYLMAKKAKTPTHFYPLALATYDLFPPPETIQRELGERRHVKRTSIHCFFGPECDMEQMAGSEQMDKQERRKNRAHAIWSTVKALYDKLVN